MYLLSFILGLFLSSTAVAEFQAPATPNPVNDYAHVLTRSGKERIAQAVVTLKADVGAQVGVLIVDSLDGSTIEDASMKVATNWKLGSQDKDDGILVFIAVKDRKMRVEVGRGLEGIITDYYAKKITSGMKPGLRAGNYDEAVLAAIDGISNRIKERSQEITSKSGATSTTSTTTETSDSSGNIFLFFLALFGLGGLISFYITIQNKKREEAESRRIARRPQTPEQRELARQMYKDVSKRAVKDPGFPKPEKKSRSNDDDDDGFVAGVVAGSLLSGNGHKNSSDDDDGGGFGGGFGSSDSGSSSSGSDFGGGGGDFGGGGSSDSF